MKNFDWSQISKDNNGFVDYRKIPSMPVRRLVAAAEKVKLEEELKARKQWYGTESNQAKIYTITEHLNYLDRELLEEGE